MTWGRKTVPLVHHTICHSNHAHKRIKEGFSLHGIPGSNYVSNLESKTVLLVSGRLLFLKWLRSLKITLSEFVVGLKKEKQRKAK